jgi:hypothetical protein
MSVRRAVRETSARICFWFVCSLGILASLIFSQVLNDRIIVASKLDEIGVCGIYVVSH